MSSPTGVTPDTYPTLPPPPAAPVVARPPKRPLLAMFLSLLFAGVGQLYNGQTAKAFALFAAFAAAIYLAGDVGMPFPLVIPFVIFYSAIDAYRSAALINLRAEGRPAEPEVVEEESPTWGFVLLGVGLLLLLNNLGFMNLVAVRRFWPLVLVIAGFVFLRRSLKRREAAAHAPRIDDGPVV
jgi:hypothetical protein